MNCWTLDLWTSLIPPKFCALWKPCALFVSLNMVLGVVRWLLCGLGGSEHCMSSDVNVAQSVYLETPLKNMDDHTLAANLKTLRDAQVECPIRFRWMLLSQPCS